MSERTYPYAPPHAYRPGESLAEVLESRGMRQADLAERTGLTPKTINEIVKGKVRITPSTALQLERVLGMPASFWNNLQRRYDEVQAAQEETARLGQRLSWARQFPTRDLARWGWIEASRDRVEELKGLLNFFGTASPEAWDDHWKSVQVAFRRVAERPASQHVLACWLRRGELEAEAVATELYEEDAFRSMLIQARGLSRLPGVEFLAPLVQHGARAGVAVVFVPELPGMHTYGATRWLSPTRALIQLSLRRKSDDHLWFTFFHEAAHILLHPKKAVFIEGQDGTSVEEEQANRFARDVLIAPDDYRALVADDAFDAGTVVAFSKQIGVAPGIVVGRLQHERLIPYSKLNELKRHYAFAKPS